MILIKGLGPRDLPSQLEQGETVLLGSVPGTFAYSSSPTALRASTLV
jgi:hypothetical protein